MILLEEFIIKLSYFFFIGYVFTLVEIFFLSFTEDMPLKKESFNILDYFSLSYGIFLPIFTFFLSQPYYPIGTSKFKNFQFSFEIDHTSSKFFAYLFLLFIFCISLKFTTIYYHSLSPFVLIYLGWFYQVLLAFLIFQLIPFYPSLMGIALIKEIRGLLLKYNKIHYTLYLGFFAEVSIFIYMAIGVSINYFIFNNLVKDFTIVIIQMLNSMLFYFILGSIIFMMCMIFYIKKREYYQYLAYIKNLLKDAFLKETPKKQEQEL